MTDETTATKPPKIVCAHCAAERGEDPARCAECGSTEFAELQEEAAPTETDREKAAGDGNQ